jgi:hypothetical protein
MKEKIKLTVFFLLAFAFVGYVREFFFVHLNIIMYSKYYQNAPSRPIPTTMTFFTGFSYEFLYYSKYIYTLLFTLLFFGLNYYALKKLTASVYLSKLLVYSYAILLILAGLSLLFGYFINGRLQDDEYTLSRWLMGIAQSPIICLILLASEKLYHKTTLP